MIEIGDTMGATGTGLSNTLGGISFQSFLAIVVGVVFIIGITLWFTRKMESSP